MALGSFGVSAHVCRYLLFMVVRPGIDDDLESRGFI